MNNKTCKASGNQSSFHWFGTDGLIIYHSYFDSKSNKIIEEECDNPCSFHMFSHYRHFNWDKKEYLFSHVRYIQSHIKIPIEEQCHLNFECPTCEYIDKEFE